jgi:F-type H+-transporting ATPase subunit delta
MTVTITSATTLAPQQAAALRAKLTAALGDHIDCQFREDPTLLGGLRIQTPTKTIDLSLAARLNQLKHQLLS